MLPSANSRNHGISRGAPAVPWLLRLRARARASGRHFLGTTLFGHGRCTGVQESSCELVVPGRLPESRDMSRGGFVVRRPGRRWWFAVGGFTCGTSTRKSLSVAASRLAIPEIVAISEISRLWNACARLSWSLPLLPRQSPVSAREPWRGRKRYGGGGERPPEALKYAVAPLASLS